jgi:hypothetical protein
MDTKDIGIIPSNNYDVDVTLPQSCSQRYTSSYYDGGAL